MTKFQKSKLNFTAYFLTLPQKQKKQFGPPSTANA